MVLDYLDFDHSENADGSATWDAMACVLPARLPAALGEAKTVLAWAHGAFGAPGEWGEWDFDLQCQQDGVGDLCARFDGDPPAVRCQPTDAGRGRCTLTLTLSGAPAFGEALVAQFSLG